MTKNNIKSTLVALGLTGAVIIGGVAVELSSPDTVDEQAAPVEGKCLEENIVIDKKENLCIDANSYNLIKGILKQNKLDGLYQFTSTGRLHFAIINHELKKQNIKITPQQLTTDEIWVLANSVL